MEELVDDWIDRELTPVIQKQVSCRACSQVSICSIERRSLPAICLSGSAPLFSSMLHGLEQGLQIILT